jgi:hypothetical protein
MIGFVKKYLKKYLNRNFITIPEISSYPLKLKDDNMYYIKSLGDRNPDKTFYIIWRDYYGSGFFSNYTFVLCHLLIAKKNNFIPVVDFKNFKTLYNENEAINGTENAWNYYYEHLNQYQLEEVYKSKNVLFCDGKFPKNFSYNLTEIDGAFEISKEIKFNKTVERLIDDYIKIDTSYLGVHYRGKEQNLADSHPFGPTYKQIIANTKMLLKKYNLSKIYIVTEDLRVIEIFEKNFPNQVFYTNSFRTKGTNAYKLLGIRDNHRYNLGLEILRDAQLLSQCAGILYSSSNVNEYARLINNNQYKFQCEIKNGTNSNHPIYSKLKFNLIKRLPKALGGLYNEVVIKENGN